MTSKQNNLDFSGIIQNRVEEEVKFNGHFNSHIVNIGEMIQKMENSLLDSLEKTYLEKSKDTVRTLRSQISKLETQTNYSNFHYDICKIFDRKR